MVTGLFLYLFSQIVDAFDWENVLHLLADSAEKVAVVADVS